MDTSTSKIGIVMNGSILFVADVRFLFVHPQKKKV